MLSLSCVYCSLFIIVRCSFAFRASLFFIFVPCQLKIIVGYYPDRLLMRDNAMLIFSARRHSAKQPLGSERTERKRRPFLRRNDAILASYYRPRALQDVKEARVGEEG